MTKTVGARRPPRIRWSKVLGILLLVVLILWAAIELFPILFMFFNSVKTNAEIMGQPFGIPARPRFMNYVEAWRGGKLGVPIARYFLNSLFVTAGTLAMLMFTGSLAGYALARYKFPLAPLASASLIWALAIPNPRDPHPRLSLPGFARATQQLLRVDLRLYRVLAALHHYDHGGLFRILSKRTGGGGAY